MGDDLIIRPNPGPQTAAFRSNAKELLYGGAAGAGKSFFLVADPLRFVEHPRSRALLLRRTTKQLEDSLIAETERLYPHFGAKFNGTKLTWTFPSGARVRLGHMEHDKNKYDYDGAPFSWIGWDELTHFLHSQYTFMFSRLRSAYGVPTFMRATTNPGGPGHRFVLERFAPWLYPPDFDEYAGARAKPGEKFFYRRTSKGTQRCEPTWHDPECRKGCREGDPCPRHKPLSRTFIPGRLADNPYLEGTDYEASLDELNPIERAQKKFGDWMIKPASGKVFQRGKIPIVPAAPATVLCRARFWDRGGTDDGGDWTVGVRMAALANGLWCVEHVVREQLGPGGVAQLIANTAKTDPPGTVIGIEQDPGSAGKFEAHYYVSALAGFTVKILPTQGESKLARAGPLSAQAAVENLICVAGTWNHEFVTELNDFPDGSFDDQVDAASGAFRLLVQLVRAMTNAQRGAGGVRVRVA
mgnify:CR=1 FL=1